MQRFPESFRYFSSVTNDHSFIYALKNSAILILSQASLTFSSDPSRILFVLPELIALLPGYSQADGTAVHRTSFLHSFTAAEC